MSSTSESLAPRVTVVIPIRNEAKQIVRCLRSVLDQNYPVDRREVLVIDGESDDGTLELLEPFVASGAIRVISNPQRIPAAAMNLALQEATGEFLARLDGHAYWEKDFLNQAVRLLQNMDVECVGGVLVNVGDTAVGRVLSTVMASPLGVGNALFRYLEERRSVDTVAFGVYRMAAVQRTGPFDVRMMYAEDDDFNYRFTKMGHQILLCPELRVNYVVRGSVARLFRQYYNYGQGRVRFAKKHGRVTSLRQLAPPSLVTGLVCSMIMGVVTSFWWAPLIFMLPYASFLTVSMFLLCRRVPAWGVGLIPIGLAAMHIGYGLGFLTAVSRQEIINPA